MDRFISKQEIIQAERARLCAAYPALWSGIIDEWKQPGEQDCAWLAYSANYLFRTSGIRWALDPLRLGQRVPDAPEMDLARDLEGLSFVLQTHSHKDHLDLTLLSALKDLPILWVMPESVLDLASQAGIRPGNIIVPRPLQPIELYGTYITPFTGSHFVKEAGRPGGLRGVPSMGYLVEFNGKRWLFPGDVRDFSPDMLPDFGRVDGAFVHLWLGRGAAMAPPPSMLETFCGFCISLRTSRLVVAHLEELGRDADDYWDESHYRQVRDRLAELAPGIKMRSAHIGDRIEL